MMSNITKFKVAKCNLKENRMDPADLVKQHIFVARGQRVMLDSDLRISTA